MTDVTAPPRTRPVIVTIAVVLIYITAIASVAVGVIVLLSRYQVPDSAVLWVSLLGAAVILLGLLMIALASGVSRGSNFSRVLLTVYLAIAIALHVTTIVSTDVWDWSPAVQTLLDLAILAALWLPPGSRYFARAITP